MITFDDYVRVLGKHVPLPGNYQLTTRLVDLGLDSLSLIRLVVALEETCGVCLAEEQMTAETFENVGSLWSALLEASACL